MIKSLSFFSADGRIRSFFVLPDTKFLVADVLSAIGTYYLHGSLFFFIYIASEQFLFLRKTMIV